MVFTEILLGVFILGACIAGAVIVVYTIELLSRIKIGIVIVCILIFSVFILLGQLIGSYVLQNWK